MTNHKERIRQGIRRDQRLRQPSEPAATAIRGRLAALPPLQAAARIALFAALPDEVDLSPLARTWLAAGRDLAYPRYAPATGTYEMVFIQDLSRDLIPGVYGIAEPRPELSALPSAALQDLTWLVPGLAFDVQGRRLGRGKGHYDRLLKHSQQEKIGIARDWQILPELPAADHDVPMDVLVTEARVILCRAISTN